MNNCGWVRNGGKCILEQENKELKDNRNKLKAWLEEMIDYEEYDKVERDTFKKVLEKLQEIEGGMNETNY